ncbi:hypothetical protein R3W88_010447 [Solanum pinnatisectum]|uniref:Uncharacterized protein n=1 Tax=Solanum pinnatisectum TaxID=50273 RepID=A0AAV9MEB5_9SOLN|nr:hypothetical protein R3W88_010447 [Solanum pinnatisectum]
MRSKIGLKPIINEAAAVAALKMLKFDNFWTLKSPLSATDLQQPQRARRVAFLGFTKSENSTAGTESILGQRHKIKAAKDITFSPEVIVYGMKVLSYLIIVYVYLLCYFCGC